VATPDQAPAFSKTDSRSDVLVCIEGKKLTANQAAAALKICKGISFPSLERSKI
jgi:hypothetical protein